MVSFSLKAKLFLACALCGAMIIGLVILSLWGMHSQSTQLAINLIMTVGGLSLFSIFGFGFVFSKSISKTLIRITQGLDTSSHETWSSSQSLSNASQKLSDSAGGAASSLQETVSSLEELASMVKTNADNAKEANALSQRSRLSAEQGEREIQKLILAMSEVAQGSKQIEEIIGVIEDIAFQTNLLALNAAVEAARAGEQGRGFAVVAEAVRNLAQRSASSAKDISNLIRDAVEKSDSGAAIAGASGAVLSEVVTSVKKVADLNNEIATASQEQAVGLEQINAAMNTLDRIVQENAGTSYEIAGSSVHLESQAKTLKELTFEMKNVVHGQKNIETPSKGNASPKAVKKNPEGLTAEKKSNLASRKLTEKRGEEIKVQDKKEEFKTSFSKPVVQEVGAKVVPLKSSKKTAAADLIPFDEDHRQDSAPFAGSQFGKHSESQKTEDAANRKADRKVGGLDGF